MDHSDIFFCNNVIFRNLFCSFMIDLFPVLSVPPPSFVRSLVPYFLTDLVAYVVTPRCFNTGAGPKLKQHQVKVCCLCGSSIITLLVFLLFITRVSHLVCCSVDVYVDLCGCSLLFACSIMRRLIPII